MSNARSQCPLGRATRIDLSDASPSDLGATTRPTFQASPACLTRRVPPIGRLTSRSSSRAVNGAPPRSAEAAGPNGAPLCRLGSDRCPGLRLNGDASVVSYTRRGRWPEACRPAWTARLPANATRSARCIRTRKPDYEARADRFAVVFDAATLTDPFTPVSGTAPSRMHAKCLASDSGTIET